MNNEPLDLYSAMALAARFDVYKDMYADVDDWRSAILRNQSPVEARPAKRKPIELSNPEKMNTDFNWDDGATYRITYTGRKFRTGDDGDSWHWQIVKRNGSFDQFVGELELYSKPNDAGRFLVRRRAINAVRKDHITKSSVTDLKYIQSLIIGIIKFE